MYVVISYAGGVILEGLLFKRGKNAVRVLARGMPEALDLKRSADGWRTREGREVEFEFLAADTPVAADECNSARPASRGSVA